LVGICPELLTIMKQRESAIPRPSGRKARLRITVIWWCVLTCLTASLVVARLRP
jgi:hypothetical protein